MYSKIWLTLPRFCRFFIDSKKTIDLFLTYSFWRMNKLPTRHNTRLSRQISNTSEGNATSILNTHLPPRRHMPIPYYIFPPCLFTTLFISRLKPRLGQSRVAELLLFGSRPDRQRVSFP